MAPISVQLNLYRCVPSLRCTQHSSGRDRQQTPWLVPALKKPLRNTSRCHHQLCNLLRRPRVSQYPYSQHPTPEQAERLIAKPNTQLAFSNYLTETRPVASQRGRTIIITLANLGGGRLPIYILAAIPQAHSMRFSPVQGMPTASRSPFCYVVLWGSAGLPGSPARAPGCQ